VHLLYVFQAEDGIRDRNVTGVQTCAFRSDIHDKLVRIDIDASSINVNATPAYGLHGDASATLDALMNRLESRPVTADARDRAARSEERRVGTERTAGREDGQGVQRGREDV